MTAPEPLCRLHWRSLLTSAASSISALYPRDEAHRAIGDLNQRQAGHFHWWFVEEPVKPEWTAEQILEREG